MFRSILQRSSYGGCDQAKLGDELMLKGDPEFVGGGPEREDGLAANGGTGETSDQSQQMIPFKRGGIGVLNRRRNGIEEGHAQPLS